MEVHHHSHTARKKWTHYFWEFLMLFLAVFCGFLAENQREHYVEHQRAKTYASNLYKELQIDTAHLKEVMIWTRVLVKKFDTLRLISEARPPVTNGTLYFYSSYAGWVRYFTSEASTIEQLRNSGNLRLLKTNVALKINEYERRLRNLENDYRLFTTEYETMNGLRLKIFDGALAVDLFTRNEDSDFKDSVSKLNPPLINNDPRLMKEFIGWVKSESNFWEVNAQDHLERLIKTADEILDLLKKEYHLK